MGSRFGNADDIRAAAREALREKDSEMSAALDALALALTDAVEDLAEAGKLARELKAAWDPAWRATWVDQFHDSDPAIVLGNRHYGSGFEPNVATAKNGGSLAVCVVLSPESGKATLGRYRSIGGMEKGLNGSTWPISEKGLLDAIEGSLMGTDGESTLSYVEKASHLSMCFDAEQAARWCRSELLRAATLAEAGR